MRCSAATAILRFVVAATHPAQFPRSPGSSGSCRRRRSPWSAVRPSGSVCIICSRTRRTGRSPAISRVRPPCAAPGHTSTRSASWRLPRSSRTVVPSTERASVPGTNVVATGGCEVCADGGHRLARLDRGVARTVQCGQELAAQRRIERTGPVGVEQLEAPRRRRRRARRPPRRPRPRAGCAAASASRRAGSRRRGSSAPIRSHSSRDRRAASSSCSARPETQTRPKLRTVAPRASASRSSWVT